MERNEPWGPGLDDRVAALEQAVAARTRDLQSALDQRSALLNELDHRVKNNLQLISSLMLMQARRADPAVRTALMSMQERLSALAVVHRRLFQSEDVSAFDLAEFIRDLVSELTASAAGREIEIVCRLEPVSAPAAQAASLALLINEILTNAYRHAFPPGRAGRLCVSLANTDSQLWIEIADDGVGRAEGREIADDERGFGLTIVELLGRQLQARIEREDAHPGFRVTIRVPLERASASG